MNPRSQLGIADFMCVYRGHYLLDCFSQFNGAFYVNPFHNKLVQIAINSVLIF